MRLLCRLSDLAEGQALGFPPPPGNFIGLFAVRKQGQVYVYENSCPHLGLALDWAPNQFLTRSGERIICATHGAEFRIEDGAAVIGPCVGDKLTKISHRIQDGVIYVLENT